MSSYRDLKQKISENIGLINLIGKVSGKAIFMGILAFLAYRLPIEEFANFAIFWSTLRMFAFYGGNNLYIIYFDRIRTSILKYHRWPIEISSNLTFTYLLFLVPFILISILIFQDSTIISLLILSSVLLLAIRVIAEFSKIDNNVFLSVLLEDILFNSFLLVTCLIATSYSTDLIDIIIAVNIALLVSVVIGIWLFVKKFNLKISIRRFRISDFSFSDFKSGLNYSLLRGNEVISNFAVRYLGLIFYGNVFVAYSHVLYQFYNIFALISISVIAGFQSKITLTPAEPFTLKFIKKSYRMITKSLLPFTAFLLVIIIFFGKPILDALFPKFIAYHYMLIWVSMAGLIYSIIQPFVFILIYNTKFTNIRITNRIQYVILSILLLLPLAGINQDIWLFALISLFALIQGILGLFVVENQKL